jgi:hypothetical protein
LTAGPGGCRAAPPDRALIVNGRADWINVRTSWADGCSRVVLLRRTGDRWAPIAMAPSFTLAELRALGAPSSVADDE